MPIHIDGEEYLSIEEACRYLGGISRETLRRKAQANGIKKYTKGITRNVYYRTTDLDGLNKLRPVEDDNEDQ
jgi:excisionase family DNA binding protein